MSQVNILSQWKIQLESSDRKNRMVALLEMVDLIDSVEECKRKSTCTVLVNSDLCHFLCENMSWHNKPALRLIGKIFSHLSELEVFFRNDFERVLKGYAKVINSISSSNPEDQTFQDETFDCFGMILQRAQQCNCDLKNLDSTINSLMNVIADLPKQFYLKNSVLHLLGHFIGLISSVLPKEDLHQEEKLCEITKKLSFNPSENYNTTTFLLTSKIIHNLLSLLSTDWEPRRVLRRIFIDKTMLVFDTAIESIQLNEGSVTLEIFSNLFYYLLTSDKLQTSEKVKLIHRFFIADGFELMMQLGFNKESGQVVQFKSFVIMTEVMNVILKVLNKSPDSDQSWHQKSYFIVTSALRKSSHQLDLNRILMFVFTNFINFIWRKSKFNKSKALSQTALVLAALNLRKIQLDSPFLTMIVTLYTSSFSNISIEGNKLLRISSEVINAMPNDFVIDLAFLKWWKTMAKPNERKYNETLKKFLINSDLQNLQPGDREAFDLKLVLKMFLDTSTSDLTLHNNLKTILRHFGRLELKVDDINELLMRIRFEKNIGGHDQLIVNFLEVLRSNISNIKNGRQSQETMDLALELIERNSSENEEKQAVIEIVTDLMKMVMIADD